MAAVRRPLQPLVPPFFPLSVQVFSEVRFRIEHLGIVILLALIFTILVLRGIVTAYLRPIFIVSAPVVGLYVFARRFELNIPAAAVVYEDRDVSVQKVPPYVVVVLLAGWFVDFQCDMAAAPGVALSAWRLI